MPDETPTGDKAVYVFIEMIALGFVLYAIEESFKEHSAWVKVGIASVLALVFFFVGVNWTKIKSKVHFSWTRRLDKMASDYRYRYGIGVLIVGFAGAYTMTMLHSLRRDLDGYVSQRAITQDQIDKLRDYLSHHEAAAVSISVVRHDEEAVAYAAQLFNAMRQTNWDVNPPGHAGPGFIQIPVMVKRPKPDDVDKDGKLLYKTPNAYVDAHDSWVEMEIDRNIAEQTLDLTGLCINVELTGQPTNPDPRRPTPDAILQNGLRYAGIEVSCTGGGYNREKYGIFLNVGHRPRRIGNQQPALSKIGRWIESLGQ